MCGEHCEVWRLSNLLAKAMGSTVTTARHAAVTRRQQKVLLADVFPERFPWSFSWPIKCKYHNLSIMKALGETLNLSDSTLRSAVSHLPYCQPLPLKVLAIDGGHCPKSTRDKRNWIFFLMESSSFGDERARNKKSRKQAEKEIYNKQSKLTSFLRDLDRSTEGSIRK